MGAAANIMDLCEGDILAGKYRIDEVLAVGGMGVVVAARHIQLDERVAIKFLLPDMLTDNDAVARFKREARAAVKIKSEHVVRVSDVATLDNGSPYMVMEYLEGGDLAAWLGKRGALPVEQAVEFVLQACEAIAEAHTLGIVHRDLKPTNLFVIHRPDGTLCVKVLDFGISKLVLADASSADVPLTKASTMVGTPLYSSPEQLRSAREVDSRTDIWALGIILYELITTDHPFVASTLPELVTRILSSAPPPLRLRRPDVPEALEAVILKCLQKDRNQRYESIAQLAGALQPFAPRRARVSLERISGIMRTAGLSSSTLVIPPSSSPVEQKTGTTESAWGRTQGPRVARSRRFFFVVGALVALVAAAYLVLRKPASGGSPTRPAALTSEPKPIAPRPAAVPQESAATAAAKLAAAVSEDTTAAQAAPREVRVSPAVAPSASTKRQASGQYDAKPVVTSVTKSTSIRVPLADRQTRSTPSSAMLPNRASEERTRQSSAFDDRQ